jgi:L-serine dehydratase
MGPERAARLFMAEHPDAQRFEVTLYGSLAKTGRGHGTDRVIRETFAPLPVLIFWRDDDKLSLPHPNTMDLAAFRGGEQTGKLRVMSVGGGDIEVEGRPVACGPEIYEESTFAAISAYCRAHRIRLSDYVEQREGKEIWDFLYTVWNTMQDAINEGLTREGTLPGGLGVERKAQMLYHQRHMEIGRASCRERV